MVNKLDTNLYNDVIDNYQRNNQILFSRNSKCLESLLQLIRLQTHRTLILWAFVCIDRIVSELKEKYPVEMRPEDAVDLCKLWAKGEVKMPVAKKALLAVHKIAKEIKNPVDIALFHAVGQGCAVVHVETHAIGIVIYELTAIVRTYGIELFQEKVAEKIKQYQSDLLDCAQKVSLYRWADFLKNNGPNKEMLLWEKKKAKE